MKVDIKATGTVGELSAAQWERLNQILLTSYKFEDTDIRLCATFDAGNLERHAEMPVIEFIKLVDDLEMVQVLGQTVEAALTPDVLADDEDDVNTRPAGADQ